MAGIKIVVLVVEDEALLRMAIVDHLEDAGFEVLEAGEAGEASEAIAILSVNPRIQILFTDIDMPGSMDGLKLVAAVRNRWPPIQIVITSGHRRVQLDDLPEEARFFPKPCNLDEIVTTIRDMASAA